MLLSKRSVILASLLMFLVGIPVAMAVPVGREESLPEVTNRMMRPGGQAEITFRVRNIGDVAGATWLFLQGRHYGNDAGVDYASQYALTLVSGACGAPQPTTISGVAGFRIPFGDLARNESRTCTLRFTRAADSSDDLGLSVCDALTDGFVTCWNGRKVNLGTLPDLVLRLDRPVRESDQGNRLLVRLHVDNPGSRDVARRVVTTPCREFGSGFFDGTPYTIDTAVADGCALAQGEVCLNFTGQNFDSYGFDAGPIPAGGSGSCVFRLTPAAGGAFPHLRNGPFAMPLYFSTDQFGMTDVPEGVGIDGDPSDDTAQLGPANPMPVPLSPALSALLAAVVLLVLVTKRYRVLLHHDQQSA